MKILATYREIHNTAGGVEKMATLLMNEMTKRGHIIHFITYDKSDAISFYPMDTEIVWHRLNSGDPTKKANFNTRFERIKSVRKIIREFKPDVILAFQEASYLTARLAVIGYDIPVIAAERNAPSRFDHQGKFKKYLAYASFIFAEKITVQWDSFASHYPVFLRSKITAVPNPVFPTEISRARNSHPVILSVGRLESQKNFRCLINAFSLITAEHPEWSLKIVGDGSEKQSLIDLISSKNLADKISIENNASDLSNLYADASIFCLPSKWEGFPNALAEALSYGLPCVGFASCDGVRDLVINGGNGLLASGNGDEKSLALCLKELIENKNLREEFAHNAPFSVAKYSPVAIFDLWENLFKKAILK